MPIWVATLISQLGLTLIQWSKAEIESVVKKTLEASEQDRLNGIRNGENAKKYSEAKSRADQIRANLDLINRNN